MNKQGVREKNEPMQYKKVLWFPGKHKSKITMITAELGLSNEGQEKKPQAKCHHV